MSKRTTKRIPASRNVPSMVPGRRGFDAAADLVLERMERAGWGVSELAERSGVTRETLSYWLNAKRPLRVDYLLAVLRVLGLEIAATRS